MAPAGQKPQETILETISERDMRESLQGVKRIGVAILGGGIKARNRGGNP